ncbi:SIR2 family protein [Burkholderia sp. L27(2015)]|uniref:SIR2 family protein n=1 Tax=Burkholderia sp. L27(2015) TaxID=1641858 RepID=UPI0020B12969|nr:SIR2 family protein [Burkholderia sp. L27(2015)]
MMPTHGHREGVHNKKSNGGGLTIQTLSGPQFATAYCQRPNQLAWLLGAGASASAGIPTGYAMITDFKKRLFCQLSGMKLREVDANDPLWIARIDIFLSTRSVLPPPNDPTEYAAAFEAVYPTPEARRNYIEDAIKKGTPSFAHRVLASLITTRRVPCVFTTNFDPLVETGATVTDQLMSASERAYLTVAALDNAERAERCLRESSWPLLAKVHGDFQSLHLKNTNEELQSQDTQIRSVLTGACGRFGLVVVGYSGRDASVMEALTEALSQPNAFPSGIYWVARSARSVLPAVTAFLEAASAAGISVTIVESQTFDELAADIADGIDLPKPLLDHVLQSRPAEVLRSVPLPTRESRPFPVLQCSAIPVLSMPKVARRIAINTPVTTARVRELLKEAEVWAVAASNGREIAAFGPDEGLLRAFEPVGGQLAGTVELHPERDSWALGLLYDALTRAVCRNQPLFARMRRAGHYVLAAQGSPKESREASERRNARLLKLKQAYSAALFGTVPKQGFLFNEGVQLRLERAADRWWCAFEPTTHVDVPWPDKAEPGADDDTSEPQPGPVRRGDPVIDWRRELWANRYNNVWARIVAAWATMLAGEENGTLRAMGTPGEAGVDAVFQVSPVTAWSRPSHDHDYFSRGGR